MKEIIGNIATFVGAILITIAIVKAQNAQAVGNYDEITNEQRWELQQHYENLVEGRK